MYIVTIAFPSYRNRKVIYHVDAENHSEAIDRAVSLFISSKRGKDYDIDCVTAREVSDYAVFVSDTPMRESRVKKTDSKKPTAKHNDILDDEE